MCAHNHLSVSLQVGDAQRLNPRQVMVTLLRKMECILLEVHVHCICEFGVCVCVCTHMHICALSLSYYPTLDEESSKALGSLRTSEEVTPKDATVNSVRGDCGVCVCVRS